MGYFTSPNINSSSEKVVDERAEGIEGFEGFCTVSRVKDSN